MSDTEEHRTCTPNIPLLQLSKLQHCLEPGDDFFAGSKYDHSKNEEYFAAKLAYNPPTIKRHEPGLYEDIVREIRNMSVLTPYQLHYLRGVSNEQLLQIIEIYNLVMRNVNEIL
jgi:hypothetical protein